MQILDTHRDPVIRLERRQWQARTFQIMNLKPPLPHLAVIVEVRIPSHTNIHADRYRYNHLNMTVL